MPVLSKGIVLDCFYLLIFYFEKFSTDVCRLPCAVNVNLNLSIDCIVNLDFLTTKQRKKFQVRYKPHGFFSCLVVLFMFSGFLSGHDERFVKGIISDSVN